MCWKELDDIELDASPRELAHGRLIVNHAAVRALELAAGSVQKPRQPPPKSLALPLAVRIDAGVIEQARVYGQSLRNVTFTYGGGDWGHEIERFSASSDYGSIEMHARVDAAAPFALAGAARLLRAEQELASLTAAGSMMHAQVHFQGSLHGANARGDAVIAAFDPRWLERLDAQATGIDISAFKAGLPPTRMSLNLNARLDQQQLLAGRIEAINQLAGPLDAKRAPLHKFSATYVLRGAGVELGDVRGTLGASGTFSGHGSLARGNINAQLAVRGLDAHALHTALRPTRLNGTAQMTFDGTDLQLRTHLAQRDIGLDVDATRRGDLVTLHRFHIAAGGGEAHGSGEIALSGARRFAARAKLAHLDPSRLGAYPQADLNGDLDLEGTLVPALQGKAGLTLAQSRWRGHPLQGQAFAQFTPGAAHNVKVDLVAGANRMHADGGIGGHDTGLNIGIDGERLSDLDPRLSGRLKVAGRITGDLRDPVFDMRINGTALAWNGGRRIAKLDAGLKGSKRAHVADARASGDQFDATMRVEGGMAADLSWSGRLVELTNRGTYPLQLAGPVSIQLGKDRVAIGSARAAFAGGRVSIQSVLWQNGKLTTSGELASLPVAPLFAIGGVTAPATDLRVAGSWSIAGTAPIRGTVQLRRESGDIVLPGPVALPLGLSELRLDARIIDGAADIALNVGGRTLSGKLQAALGSLSRAAPLRMNAVFKMASLKPLAPLLGTTVVALDGRATLNLSAHGTLAQPQVNGDIAVAGLQLDAPQYGVRLRDGAAHAELAGDTLTLRDFSMQGGGGRLMAFGTMTRSGRTNLTWRAENFQALDSPDMKLRVDGNGTAGIVSGKLALQGTIRAQQGYFALNHDTAPRLSDDIVILGRPRSERKTSGSKSFQTKALELNLALDLGERVHVTGKGLDTDLRGTLALRSSQQGTLLARGTLFSSHGVYYAFGQRLEVERGRLIFDGPLDNPALDIIAKRKNLAVEAGVQVTGTAQVPSVQLISEPPVSDSEKLAWLTLGHGLEQATVADAALLQAAASALVSGGNALPLSQRVAKRVGLDELSLRGSGSAGSQVAALGKRFSDKLYVEYQQGLEATSALLRLSYALTRALSLRFEAGTVSSVGVYYGKSFE